MVFIKREERWLREFENSILKRVFWSKWNENGEWKRLQDEEFHDLYRLLNIIK
jgi:hypothetical protein